MLKNNLKPKTYADALKQINDLHLRIRAVEKELHKEKLNNSATHFKKAGELMEKAMNLDDVQKTSATMQAAMNQFAWLLQAWIDYVEMTTEQFAHKHGKQEEPVENLTKETKEALERYKVASKQAGWKEKPPL